MTIAQIPLLPEEYQYAPIDFACWRYFQSKRDEANAKKHELEWLKIYDNIHPEEDISTNTVVNKRVIRPRNPNDYPQV